MFGALLVAVLLSLVAAFYYLRIVKVMYFDEPRQAEPIVRSSGVTALLALNGIAVLAFGILAVIRCRAGSTPPKSQPRQPSRLCAGQSRRSVASPRALHAVRVITPPPRHRA